MPAAGRILRDLGLWTSFIELQPASYAANRSLWGSAAEEYRDFISDPEGCGWHLDRAAFETMLRDQATARGAHCYLSNRVLDVASGWRLTLDGANEVVSRFVVDASGRSAALARRLGACRLPHDRMVARWCRLRGGQATSGISSVIATPDGWWYHIAGQREGLSEGMLAFHGLPETVPQASATDLLEAARCLSSLCGQLQDVMPLGEAATTAAHTARLDRFSGSDWLAIGDAAVCFDPIASRGLFHALYSALVAAALLEDRLAGLKRRFGLYNDEISRIYLTYLNHREAVYRTEKRWPEAAFWQEAATAHPAAKGRNPGCLEPERGRS